MKSKFLVATDIDGTVLGDSESESDFYQWGINRGGVLLAYISGRSTNNILDLVSNEILPRPDFIVGSVGTRMIDLRHGAENLADEFLSRPVNFPEKEIRRLGLAHGLALQAEEDLNNVKVSFYQSRQDNSTDLFFEEIRKIAVVNTIITENYYVDVLAEGFGKGAAVKFLAQRLGLELNRVLVAGDAENDDDMFQIGSLGVLPANAVKSLHRHVDGDRIIKSEHKYAKGLLDGLKRKGMGIVMAILFLLASPAAALDLSGLERLEADVMRALRENDVAAMKGLFIEELSTEKSFAGELPGIVDNIQRALLRHDFEPWSRNQTQGLVEAGGELKAGKDGQWVISVQLPADQAAVMLYASEEDFHEFLLTLVALKRKGQWKLQAVDLGHYKAGGRDVAGWMLLAQKESSLGRPVAAGIIAKVAVTLMYPSALLRPKKEAELVKQVDQLNVDLDKVLKFPVNLLKSPGYPQIIRIEPHFEGETLVPLIHYISRLPLSDQKLHFGTAAAIVNELNQAIPGLLGAFPRVLLRVYDEPPTDHDKKYTHLNIPVDLK